MGNAFVLFPQGDRAISVVFPNEISESVNRSVLALCAALDASRPAGILNCVPAYHTLLVEYDPLLLTYGQAANIICGMNCEDEIEETGRVVRLPVCYGGEYGPDLEDVAEYTGLPAAEVISRHTARDYRVYMLGFRPGFPYLGGLDPQLATPRKQTPRARIEGGSVGIAGEQTGVYPEPSPGGWNIIGRTPLQLFDEKNLSLLHPGDILRFVPVDSGTYREIQKNGGWQL